MRVAYDVSQMGIGYRHLEARTGIFRVAESLAYGLKNSHECELFFCTSGSSQNLTGAFDYLISNPEFLEIPLIGASQGVTWEMKRYLHRNLMNTHLGIRKTSDPQRVILRLRRKILHHATLLAEIFDTPNYADKFTALDIYHSPFQPIPEYIKNIRHIKKFLTIHDLIPILYPHFFTAKEEKNFTHQALASLEDGSWVLCVSESTKNDLCNHLKRLDPNKVFVTHLAASDLFYPCLNSSQSKSIYEKYGIPDAPYVLSLSTLEPRKNIKHALQCFFQLIQQENIPDLNFVLAGGKGWKFDDIFSELSDNPKLKQRVILTGYVADEDLAALYTNALAFIYVSFYEGFGLPPLEAMQCGTPVITSNTSSLPEVVGNAGIMVNPTDINALCESISAVYNSMSLRERMSLQSIEQSKKFSWERCTQETISAYKESLNT